MDQLALIEPTKVPKHIVDYLAGLATAYMYGSSSTPPTEKQRRHGLDVAAEMATALARGKAAAGG